MKDRHILITAHGNILRAIVMVLEKLPSEKVAQLEIPTGSALVYETIVISEKLSWRRVRPDTEMVASEALPV
jgi:bisphosphoglycerate-dependent phosphoglycerate mutase